MSQVKAFVADKKGMGNLMLSVGSVLLFCLSAHFLMRSISAPVGLTFDMRFSLKARRVERRYKIFAWAAMTVFLFYSMVVAFIHAFTEVL